MRGICYSVAMSLDGYIAGPNGEADWIVIDPEIDFGAIFARFDTLLMGRRTFEGCGRAVVARVHSLVGEAEARWTSLRGRIRRSTASHTS